MVKRRRVAMEKREGKSCTCTHERERERERERARKKNEKRNKHLVLIISENGVLAFKQCVTEVKITCKSYDINFCLT